MIKDYDNGKKYLKDISSASDSCKSIKEVFFRMQEILIDGIY